MEYIKKQSDFDSQNIYAYILSACTTNICPSNEKVMKMFWGENMCTCKQCFWES